ncbi:hypothetical protein NL676_013610 [Syzygium grande]|nr:hypothetical protein NL676_013610 [Syzygium grande]
MELPVKKGANVEAMTNKGLSALQIAESLTYMGISRILGTGGGASATGVAGGGGRRGGGREIDVVSRVSEPVLSSGTSALGLSDSASFWSSSTVA